MEEQKLSRVIKLNVTQKHFDYLVDLLKSLGFEVNYSGELTTDELSEGDIVTTTEDMLVDKDIAIDSFLIPEIVIKAGTIGRVHRMDAKSCVLHLIDKTIQAAYDWNTQQECTVEYIVPSIVIDKKSIRKMEE